MAAGLPSSSYMAPVASNAVMSPYMGTGTGTSYGPILQNYNNQAGYTPMGNQQPSQYVGGGVNPLLQSSMQQQQNTINGQYLNPQSNQYLQSYYNAAAQPMIQQFQQATDPSILGGAVQSGNLFGTAPQQQETNAQVALAQGLGNLGANIFEPAYMQERQLQQGAAQGAGATAQNQYIPANELMGIGQQQQQQQQNYLSSPEQQLSQYANLIPSFLGNFGLSTTSMSGGK